MNTTTGSSLAISGTFSTLALSLMLGGCGSGGGSDSETAGIDRGGDSVPSIAVGKISGFGSVIINGVRWSTNNAEIVVDGELAIESDLAIGQIARIAGTRSNDTSGVARTVEVNDILEGVIQSVDTSLNRLIVMDQQIVINPTTVFEGSITPRSIEGLAAGQTVEISGFIDADGSITATHIELDDDDDDNDSRVVGRVSNLRAGDLTFTVNGLLVDYSASSVMELPNGTPAEGMMVEVTGIYDDDDAVLLARELRADNFFDDLDDDTEVDIEGIVTAFTATDDFELNGIAVTTTTQTDFEDGNAAEIALGVFLEIEGRFNSGGVLVAEEIEFEDSDASSDDDYNCPSEPVIDREINANVSVNGDCYFENVTVRGQVTVQEGAEFSAIDSRIDADLQSLSAAVVDLENVSVGGNIDIKETSNQLRLVNSSSENNIQLEKNLGEVLIENFYAAQDFQLKESVATITVSGQAVQNAQIESNQGDSLSGDVTVGQDAQVKDNNFTGSSDVSLTGGDQAQCIDNNFTVFATSFESVDGCTLQ